MNKEKKIHISYPLDFPPGFLDRYSVKYSIFQTLRAEIHSQRGADTVLCITKTKTKIFTSILEIKQLCSH